MLSLPFRSSPQRSRPSISHREEVGYALPPHPLDCHTFYPLHLCRHLSPMYKSKPPKSSHPRFICDRRKSYYARKTSFGIFSNIVRLHVPLRILISAISNFLSHAFLVTPECTKTSSHIMVRSFLTWGSSIRVWFGGFALTITAVRI